MSHARILAIPSVLNKVMSVNGGKRQLDGRQLEYELVVEYLVDP